jgi:hypothetical protein
LLLPRDEHVALEIATVLLGIELGHGSAIWDRHPTIAGNGVFVIEKILENWDLRYAIRELIANAIDAF